MTNSTDNMIYSVLLIVLSAGVSVSFQVIRTKLKKIDEAYEKLKKDCDSKISKNDLKELLELYLKPLINEIGNIKDTLKDIIKVKIND